MFALFRLERVSLTEVLPIPSEPFSGLASDWLTPVRIPLYPGGIPEVSVVLLACVNCRSGDLCLIFSRNLHDGGPLSYRHISDAGPETSSLKLSSRCRSQPPGNPVLLWGTAWSRMYGYHVTRELPFSWFQTTMNEGLFPAGGSEAWSVQSRLCSACLFFCLHGGVREGFEVLSLLWDASTCLNFPWPRGEGQSRLI